MVKAVIFDLNGVLIQGQKFSERFHIKFGILTEEFLSALKEIMDKVRKPGAGDTFAYWKPYLDKWGISLSRQDFFDFWFGDEKEVAEMVELAGKLKEKGVKIFILSNNFAERTAHYEKASPFLSMFDKAYYSWQTGFVKPDSQAFKNLLSENNLKPEECIYFDNAKENVETANSLGIKSFLFENSDGLEKVLKEYNLI